jgi:transcriptional regulator with XRE-family HTH domain
MPERTVTEDGDRRREDILSSLAEAIRARRQGLGLSQDQLGYLAGLHRTYVGGVERGERNVTIVSLSKIADALQMEPHELLQMAGL